ncbi:DUF3566 domain-containing protein [Myceligenerans indicum]|nr:DUF3566 domain-containing protein [Myceligenerans indicum]
MTSGNDTGQGSRSTTTEVDDEFEKAQVRDGTTSGAGQSEGAAGKASADHAADGGDATDQVAEEGQEAADGSTGRDTDVPAAGASPAVEASTEPEAEPARGGFWRAAYEAGADAPSSRHTTDSAAASNGAPENSAPSSDSPGTSTASSAEAEVEDIEETTKPRVSRETNSPGDGWQSTPSPQADDAPAAGAEGTAVTSESVAQNGEADEAASMKQGAVKAAQAALAAARNAARKVSSAMPETSTSSTEPQQPASPVPAEMHYSAGAVHGSASVPLEETVPVGGNAGPDGDTTPGSMPGVTPKAGGGPRRVRLAISRIDPWSVMKLAFLLSVAIAIMTVVATVVFWSVIDSLGVFDKIQTFVTDAIGEETNFNVMQYVEFERVVSLSTLVAICNVVLLTALATIMTFLYNITAALVGGVHMTLTDD